MEPDTTEGANRAPAQGVDLARQWAKLLGNHRARLAERAAFAKWETGHVPVWAWKSPRLGESDDIRESRKHCPECGNWYKLDSEHWHKNSYGKRGWHSICKSCRNDAYRRNYARKKAMAQ